MPALGVRMQVLVGPTVPLPAPYPVVDALREVEVRHNDTERDGFQMTFTLGRSTPVEYDVLATGLLDPPARVVLIVIFGAIPTVLIDGIITDHQVMPASTPGDSRLTVSGVDVSVMMDLEEKNATYPNQPDSLVVTRLLASYAQYGLVPVVIPTPYTRIELQGTPTQQGTDYQHIQRLAERNGYVFYVEAGPAPLANTAYFGPQQRAGVPQGALTVGMGGETNVASPPHARFDALGPASPRVTIVEKNTGISLSIPAPSVSGLPLALRPASSLRTTLSRDTANLDPAQAAARAVAASSSNLDAVTMSGEVDAVRYGSVLRSRRLTAVRGVGLSYDGLYYTQQVTHSIRAGEYKQRFTLRREGRGATTPVVPT